MSYIIFGRDVPQKKMDIIADASQRYISRGHNALWLRTFNKWYITATSEELIVNINVNEALWKDIEDWDGKISNTQDGDTIITYPPKAFSGILTYITIGEISDPTKIKSERRKRERELNILGKTGIEGYLKRLNKERKDLWLLPLTREEFNDRARNFINENGSIRDGGWLFDKIIYDEHKDRDKIAHSYKMVQTSHLKSKKKVRSSRKK